MQVLKQLLSSEICFYLSANVAVCNNNLFVKDSRCMLCGLFNKLTLLEQDLHNVAALNDYTWQMLKRTLT